MQEEDIELIRKGLLQLFTDGQEVATINVPHEVGLSPEIAKRYGIKTSTINARHLAEFLASIDDLRERGWCSVKDAVGIARIASGLGSAEDLANLDEVLESLTELVWTAEVTWFEEELPNYSNFEIYSGVKSTTEGITELLDAEVSPEELSFELYKTDYDVVALSKSRNLPIWLCHWIHESAWQLSALQRMYDDALEEDYLEQDAPRLAEEYARRKSND